MQVNGDLLNDLALHAPRKRSGLDVSDLDLAGDRPWSSARDARNAASCASGGPARRGTCARARPTRRPDIHTPAVYQAAGDE
jgi:hypothetical protein